MTHLIHKFVALCACVLLFPAVSFAQESVTLSISPTLFDMSAMPGQNWQSALKIINVNPFDLTVYVEVVNFAPQGEGGDGRFIPVFAEETEGSTLAEWISISREAVVIPREQSKEIPFSVAIPNDATPGGHFAAILVGTRPLVKSAEQSQLQTAQMVTSLFFARVDGDVIESGLVREFMTDGTYLSKPEVDFLLRFENKGNVHLKPQGEIKIYNMWGEERGIIPINQSTNFGNVLPESIRKFTFTWKGEWSISDIGRYTAVVTLGYGTDERQFTSSKTVFWIIPFTLIFWILIIAGTCIGTVVWLVRRYIRHTLALAGINIEKYEEVQMKAKSRQLQSKASALKAPVAAGILNLKRSLEGAHTLQDRGVAILKNLYQYRLFILAVCLIILCVGVLVWYILNANAEYRPYEIVYTSDTAVTSISSEEIIYTSMKAATIKTEAVSDEELPNLAIINRTTRPGLGAEMRIALEELGYTISELSAESTSPQKRTVIVYESAAYDDALTLSAHLDNALISAREEDTEGPPITVYVGSDFSSE